MLLLLPLAGCASAEPAPGMAAVPREGFLPGMNDVRIHYRVLGAGPDVVVAVHGGPGAGIGSILPELRPLAERFTVVFYDQRGGGRSELPADVSRLGADEHVGDLEAVRVHFGLDRMKVVALSFGALIAARYAEEHPERVERMIFFGATGPQRAEAARLARAEGRPDPAAVPAATRERFSALLRSLMTGSTTDPAGDCRKYEALGRELAAAQGRSVPWKGTSCAMPPEAIRYSFQHTAREGPRSLGDWDFTGSLGQVRAPLLVIHGAKKPGVEAQAAWARAAPHGRLLVLPGHAPSADSPGRFFAAVETFLGGSWPAGAYRP
jgi:proline iminopeptidase